MKKFAYYLPQFHEIPENNMWWGKGFTEWVNVKHARSLFKNHKQPLHPLNDNYYRLDNPDTLRWQAKLAQKYSIDGMIFYHYYFCGKKLLEKPAELLLENKDIPMNFFFCWANHSWYRSWEGSKEILMKQDYGGEADWRKHFDYLLPFFSDARYEKRNNKPLIMFFDTDFDELSDICCLWNELAIENGFSGIECLIKLNDYESLSEIKDENCLFYFREPGTANKSLLLDKKNIVLRIKMKAKRVLGNNGYKMLPIYDGNKFYNEMISHYNKNVIPGLFFEWDNTSRHGYRGYVINPPSKEVFMRYMDTIKDSEYVFINAWNEWCEGMILEPSQENGYKYLEWINEWEETHK